MGLDMYLSAEIGLADYDFYPDDKELARKIYEVLGVPKDLLERSGYVSVQMPVGYWRKANAIHNWFVQNVQDGVDECQRVYVSDDDLASLEDVCRRVTENHDLAPTLLPTRSGFFFGGTDYDEWYWDDVAATLTIIERAKKLREQKPSVRLYYRSSW